MTRYLTSGIPYVNGVKSGLAICGLADVHRGSAARGARNSLSPVVRDWDWLHHNVRC